MGEEFPASAAVEVRDSVVFVLVGRWEHSDDEDAPLRQPDGRAFRYEGHGLGFVFGTPNYAFTCAHVVADRGPQDIVVVQRTTEGRVRPVDGLMSDPGVDVALLHTPHAFAVAPVPARLAHRIHLGEDAYFWTPLINQSADGNVLGMSSCLRRAMVAAICDPFPTRPSTPGALAIVIDALVPRGSSGSPLICSHGILAGMVFAEEMRPETSYEVPSGMGWALPRQALFDAAAFFAPRNGLADLEEALSSEGEAS